MPTWLIVILAIAAGIGMAVAAKKKEDPKFKPLAIVGVIVLLACAIFHIDNQIGIFGESKAQPASMKPESKLSANMSRAKIPVPL